MVRGHLNSSAHAVFVKSKKQSLTFSVLLKLLMRRSMDLILMTAVDRLVLQELGSVTVTSFVRLVKTPAISPALPDS